MYDLVLGHASFLGHTGYANHTREFFTALNELVSVRVRNFAHTLNLNYLTKTQKDMLLKQTWDQEPWEVGTDFTPVQNMVNVVLAETNHYYFYDEYQGPKIAYNVWESTRQPEQFFQRLLAFDQFWAPSEWQRQCTIEQGFDPDRTKVVPEGVDGEIFRPIPLSDHYPREVFRFLVFGRWDYRKATGEVLQAFVDEFAPDEPVEVIASIDNPFPTPDGLKTTQDRMAHYGFDKDPRIKIVHFPPFTKYVKYLQTGHAFVSCARSEGWNLPLIEAIACGIPTICSDYGAQLEFAGGISRLVRIKDHQPVPANIFVGQNVPGTWAEPDFNHLRQVMREVYENYDKHIPGALAGSKVVREKFTWEAAARRAFEHLTELANKDVVLVSPVCKLNIGSGIHPKEGYTNVDLYYKADTQADGRSLEYTDNSVDEIYSSHFLEHLSMADVAPTLREWARVLKPNSRLQLEVPDLEWCLVEWLRDNNAERRGFSLQRIFGNQSTEGEFHKTGFTHDSLNELLSYSGFTSITMKHVWSHDQQSIVATAIKRASVGREVIIMSAYPDTHEKETAMRECYARVKGGGLPVALVTHYPVRQEVAELFDFVIYEKENVLSKGWELNYCYTEPEVVRIMGRYGNYSYQPVAILSAIHRALGCLQGKFDVAYFVESDTMLSFLQYLEHTRPALLQGYKCVAFDYVGNPNSISTSSLALDINWAYNTLPCPASWEEYLNTNDQMRTAGVHNGDAIYEHWLAGYLRWKDEWRNCKIQPPNVKGTVVARDNVIKRDLPYNIRVSLSETDDHKLVVFLLNTNEVLDEVVGCRVMLDDTPMFSDNLIPSKIRWFTIPKKLATLSVYIQNELTHEFDLSPKQAYTDDSFKFYRDELKCLHWEGGHFGSVKEHVTVDLGFVDGARVTLGGEGERLYRVEFIDSTDNSLVYATDIKPGYWAGPNRQYYTNWHINVYDGDKLVTARDYDCSGQRVLVGLESKSLGDNIAWMPYIEEFGKVHKCTMVASTFYNSLFKSAYPMIEFVDPGTTVHNLYALYRIGCFDDDLLRNKFNWRVGPIQKIASDILGLPYVELKPKLGVDVGDRLIENKYVCLSEHSTMQAKYWNYPGGWQEVVDHINSVGYDVVVISSETSQLQNVRRRTGKSLEETIKTIAHADAFLGVSSGPPWIAWALGVPVIMISGISKVFNEFQSDVIRVINTEVCHGCANDPDFVYNRGDWGWCPRLKDFECTRKILPENVMGAFDRLTESGKSNIDNSDLFYTPDHIEATHQGPITGPPTWGYGYNEIFNLQTYVHKGCKVEPGDVVVDCGANIGVFSRYAFQRGARAVYGFEPDPENFGCLVRNNRSGTFFNQALSDKAGTQFLHLHTCRGGHTLTTNNINQTRTDQKVEVPVITLDQFFMNGGPDRVDYLKVDIEGSECELLAGCSDDNLARIRKIGMEYHHMIYDFDKERRQSVLQRLQGSGFRCELVPVDDQTQMIYAWRDV